MARFLSNPPPQLWFSTLEGRPETGLKVQCNPGKDTKLNIYLIRGLPRKTDRTAEHDVPWQLSLLQKELPWARIATYGYNAQLLDINGLAQNLMNEIMMDNDVIDPEIKQLPNLLVAYGFGDLVCKKALMLSEASMEEDLKLFLTNTRALISRQDVHRDIVQPTHGRIGSLLTPLGSDFLYQEVLFRSFATRNPKLETKVLDSLGIDTKDDEFYRYVVEVARRQILGPELVSVLRVSPSALADLQLAVDG